jgi:hypothetical protein
MKEKRRWKEEINEEKGNITSKTHESKIERNEAGNKKRRAEREQ